MNDITINPEQIQKLLDLVDQKYPNWQGFNDPRLIDEEINYKRKAIQKAQSSLSEQNLSSLIAQGKFDDFIELLRKVAQGGENLLYLATPQQGDINILFQDNLDKVTFCQAVFDLLYGIGSSAERLGKYVTYVNENSLPNKWTFPTYYLFVCHPDSEMFIKPQTTKTYMEFLDFPNEWSSIPSQIIYSKVLQIANEFKKGFEKYGPQDMVDIQSLLWVVVSEISNKNLTPSKRAEFLKLYNEFKSDYIPTEEGKDHIDFYTKGREQAQQNYVEIIQASNAGFDITDLVLLKLLPYTNSEGNRIRGAWIHVAPSIRKDIKDWFQGVGWTRKEDWKKISQAILQFIKNCIEDPAKLDEACKEFSTLPYSKGIQTGMLTPILNALKPESFVLINNKSRQVLNYFLGTNFEQPLINYPQLNSAALAFLEANDANIRLLDYPDALPEDLFDMFSHWMVTVKKFFKNQDDKLGTPFSKMFTNMDEANWAFDLLQKTSEGLRVESAEDPLIATTSRFFAGGNKLHFDYGLWLILGVQGRPSGIVSIQLALLTDRIKLQWLNEGKFAQDRKEKQISLYEISIDEFKHHENEILSVFSETLPVVKGHFNYWKGSPYKSAHNKQLALAILQPDMRDQILRNGIQDGVGPDVIPPEGVIRYWKIAPGENAWNWEESKKGGFISIGWEETGDVSRLTHEEFENKCKSLLEEHPELGKKGIEQVWDFAHIQVGDRIVANRGTKEVIGIGTVTGAYTFIPNIRHGHHLQVDWEDTQVRPIMKGHWVKTMIELSKEEFEEIGNIQPSSNPVLQPVYTIKQCSEETGIEEDEIIRWIKALDRKGQVIFYGPPGTGKTFISEKLAQHLVGGGDGFFELIQFHPEVSYEDFIQGIRPKTLPEGGLYYPVVPGRFIEFCEKAKTRTDICILIIDEINRANLSRVFGELMYLLEYRNKRVELSAGNYFTIPSNVRIIGTMNTADRSIALVDHALRRRFAFLSLYPNFNILLKYHERNQTGFSVDGLLSILEDLNKQIADRHYSIGTSYFLRTDIETQIEDIWKMEIEPYLEEYFFDQPEKCLQFNWEKISSKINK